MYRKVKYLCIALLYFAAAVSLNDGLNVFALYGAIPLSFLMSFRLGNSIKDNNYIKKIVWLFVWLGVSYLGAVYVDEANNQMKNYLGVFLLTVTLANLSKDEECIPWLYGIYVILFIQALVYANNHIMAGGFDVATDRLNDAKLNANTIAYYTFFVTFAIYILGENHWIKKKLLKNIFRLLFLSMYIVSFMVALFTASRQVLIIQIPLLLFLSYLRYIKGATKLQKFVFIIITFAVCLASVDRILDAYDNSFLKIRAEQDAKEDVRMLLLKDAVSVGMENPLFGVGPGNYVRYSFNNHFSHCTFTELFANTGFIGVFIFGSMLFLYIKRQWLRMRTFRSDKTFLVFLIVGLIYLIDNIFYVFYIDLWLMGFFILIASHAEVYYRLKISTLEYRLFCQ